MAKFSKELTTSRDGDMILFGEYNNNDLTIYIVGCP